MRIIFYILFKNKNKTTKIQKYLDGNVVLESDVGALDIIAGPLVEKPHGVRHF
jgi:hypothetical protein